MSYLSCISRCNTFNASHFIDFLGDDGQRIGWVHRDNVAVIKKYSDDFVFCDDKMQFGPSVQSFEERTDVVTAIGNRLRETGLVTGWRDELYPATMDLGEEVAFHFERALAPFFGLRAFGVHINGYVKTEHGLKMWIAKRSKTKQTSPGMLDNFVAGGHPAGLSLMDNVLKECWEEARVPQSLSALARLGGVVAYRMEKKNGLKPDVLYCYDLELPSDFVPANMDGEVEDFTLMSMDEVEDLLQRSSVVKENSGLVMIDFLVRHGIVTKENNSRFTEIQAGLFQE